MFILRNSYVGLLNSVLIKQLFPTMTRLKNKIKPFVSQNMFTKYEICILRSSNWITTKPTQLLDILWTCKNIKHVKY